MQKKEYQSPTIDVVELKQTGMLMTSGDEVLRTDYGEPIVDTWVDTWAREFSWDEESFDSFISEE